MLGIQKRQIVKKNLLPYVCEDVAQKVFPLVKYRILIGRWRRNNTFYTRWSVLPRRNFSSGPNATFYPYFIFFFESLTSLRLRSNLTKKVNFNKLKLKHFVFWKIKSGNTKTKNFL